MIDDREARGSEDERRAHDRARLIVDVYFNGEDAIGVASTKDISPGGLYMNTQVPLPEGARLLLRIPVSDKKQLVVEGDVVYVNPGRGVGIRFHNLSEDARQALNTALSEQ